MQLLHLPNELIIYITSFLDIQHADIANIRTTNVFFLNISKKTIHLIHYPWNDNDSFSGLTLSYHTHRMQRKRLMEMSERMQYENDMETMLIDNEWI